MTETKPTVFEAWSAVMHDLREIRKGESGKGVSFNFRGVDTVMNKVGPLLRKHGVIVTPTEVVSLDQRPFQSKSGTAMMEVFLRVKYRAYGPAGDFFDGGSAGQASDASDKATAQAMSVAYRVFLLQSLTMPTDSDDPDLNTATHGEAEETAAVAQGWSGGAAQRAEVFAAGVARMNALPAETRQSVVDWGKAQGLGPDTLTPAMAEEWAQMVTLAEGFGDDGAATNGVDLAEVEAEPDAPEVPDFDRKTAWETLHEWHGNLANDADFNRIQENLEAAGITDATLTQEQAKVWWDLMEGLPLKTDEAPAPTTDPKAQGWKSKAERERQHASLASRTDRLATMEHVTDEMLAGLRADFPDTAEMLTKDRAVAWLRDIELLEEAPFS